MQTALDTQVGGGHYKELLIQPVEYIAGNNLNWFQGNIIKYATRYPYKNKEDDLRKIIHYAHLALEMEYAVGMDEMLEELALESGVC